MTENLPQFERLPINPKKEEEDKEIWQPNWNCFCCQDTGQIQAHLVRLIISDYDPNRDRIPVCQGCNKFDRHNLMDYGVLDTRFDLFLCKKLDRIAREDWKQVTQKQFEIVKQRINQISKSHSLSSSDRTDNDNREVKQRKAEVEAITPDQWKAMRDDYLVGKKDEV
ncbi:MULTISPECIES: hypothetical protein [Nostoc]|uniref:HNH endonuclease n=1 Tax=Nostoc paludosum FACHB-159 TaxID=2692908 RepID=A0ABR8KI63_9NOSO|nr:MULTISPECIES: hypothetical protein [Nostoc]MBD2682891.1 hypothetical protein [Nostoc sp. FACHB-857]MBD2739228.1 hypothetical protein [Nostoc paludosum FACHB-159]